MPTNLHHHFGAGYLHFLTTSCYQRAPYKLFWQVQVLHQGFVTGIGTDGIEHGITDAEDEFNFPIH